MIDVFYLFNPALLPPQAGSFYKFWSNK